jgi:tetratricopeptide (TPR) repeat protein
LAFLSVFFFMILAPTSSVMPILDLIVEHRMYLPLIPVIVFLVLAFYAASQKLQASAPIDSSRIRLAGIVILGISLSSLGALTYLRNEDYQNSIDLWRDAVAKAPSNPRAHHNYAFALAAKGLNARALIEYTIATTQAPNSPLFQSNFGLFLARLGDYENALKHLKRAVQLDPTNYRYVVNLGLTLIDKGSLDNAVICLNEAIRCNPMVPVPYVALASAFQAKHEWQLAKENLERAINLDRENPDFRYRLGRVLISMGDYPAARSAFQLAIQLDGNPENLHSEVGWIFHEQGMEQEAISHLRLALRIKPDHIKSQIRLAWILATSPDDSVRQGPEALALAEQLTKDPASRTPEHLDLLAVCLAEVGRFAEAQGAIREALSKSRERQDDWAPALEKRLELFEKGQAYRERPSTPPANRPSGQSQASFSNSIVTGSDHPASHHIGFIIRGAGITSHALESAS